MSLDAASLPADVDLLRAMLVAADAELDQLRMLVAKLRRMAFGRSSERLTREADQLELGLEEAEAEAAASLPPAVARARDASRPHRQPLWTCPGKVESSPDVKGELNDEAATVYEGVRG